MVSPLVLTPRELGRDDKSKGELKLIYETLLIHTIDFIY
jgi:hypothetical protein